MKEIIVPSGKRLSWYLAAEEYLAKNITEECIFFWKVAPTVIFGRHQVMENEVNLTYCREHHVDLVRRKSGGGCVYADEGNLMTSYLSPSTHSEEVFQHYLDLMAGALVRLGVPAVKTEHNDILVAERRKGGEAERQIGGEAERQKGGEAERRKVSGNACYALPTGTIVHGTMLYDVDFEALEQAITPDHDKLAKHGVESVRQRVMNIKPLLVNSAECKVHSVEELKQRLGELVCSQHEQLPIAAVAAIEAIEKTYEIY